MSTARIHLSLGGRAACGSMSTAHAALIDAVDCRECLIQLSFWGRWADDRLDVLRAEVSE